MDLSYVCSEIEERVGRELRENNDPGKRVEILTAALYEAGRNVLPALGLPKKSVEYQHTQESVLKLLSTISIALIRSGREGKKAVSVLAELAEGCQDPLIKKKLSVYAQEILTKSDLRGAPKVKVRKGLVLAAVASLALSFAGYQYFPVHNASHVATSGVVSGPPAQPQGDPVQPQFITKPYPAAEGGRPQEQAVSQPAREEKTVASRSVVKEGEVTPVRVVNNQVLVPVVLKQGGVSIKLELLLDTGASRTGVHESAIGKLPLDLRQARSINVEVADGRSVRSRLTTIDLAVGPFNHPGQEIVIIPFTGAGALHDGLLGMDILGRHRYQLDMEKEVIRWY